MISINDEFLKLSESYLFSDIAKKVAKFKSEHPDAKVIRMGIGDVTLPLPPAVIEALHKAVDEMASADSFYGYGPEQGYAFLRDTIIKNDFTPRGIELSSDEVFISDGAKSDIGNFGDILGRQCVVGVTDPVYPVYVDSSVIGGRAGVQKDGKLDELVYISCTCENNFIPSLPKEPIDILYLCYPNNPTGTTLTKAQLKKLVDFALANDILILFDAAYEAYISDPDIPHSIYEIDGAKSCAVEFRSFSKTAGFTGLRCGYTVVPKELQGKSSSGESVSINKLWNRRQTTKFNGTAYIIQRAAEAVYSDAGKAQIKEMIKYYMDNASLILESLKAIGMEVYGGENAPYIWLKTPEGISSWELFDRLLNELNIVGTPGVGFGPCGEGYFRLTAFGKKEDTIEAIERIRNWKV